jgi:hypothetical protein
VLGDRRLDLGAPPGQAELGLLGAEVGGLALVLDEAPEQRQTAMTRAMPSMSTASSVANRMRVRAM